MSLPVEAKPEPAKPLWERDDVDVLLRAWAKRNWVEILMGIGIALRVIQYLGGRTYWLDEGSLAANIRRDGWSAIFGRLTSAQLAPPGFLLVESIFCKLFGGGPYSLRFFPLVGGIATLFLMRRIGARLLNPVAVGIAVGLASLSDDLMYYSSELKQYSTDVAFGLICYGIALDVLEGPLRWRKSILLALAGSLIIWFSHPAVFVLAGLGCTLLVAEIRRGDWPKIWRLVFIGSTWVLSFVGLYFVAMEQLGHRLDMWAFWEFAFPRVPPRSAWEASWPLRRVIFYLVNPLSFHSPFGPLPTALPIFALLLVGCWTLLRSNPVTLGLLVMPGFVTLLASYLQKYPFHGRLILFLAPAFLMLIAEGADRIRRGSSSKFVRIGVLVAIFLPPAWVSTNSRLSPLYREYHNMIGDRRPFTEDPANFPFDHPPRRYPRSERQTSP